MKSKTEEPKLLRHLRNFDKKEASGELIDLTEIYNDFGRPLYMSPRRIQHYLSRKNLMQFGHLNDTEELVIKYAGDKVYGNYELAILYLKSIDVYFTHSILNYQLLLVLEKL